MTKRLQVVIASLICSLSVSAAVAQVVVPQRVRVSQGVMQTLVTKKVNPDYPPDAKKDHVQGVVVLRLRIDKQGNVADAQLVSGHPALAQAAIDAVKQWKYRPYLLNNNPVEVETQVTVNFTLAD